MMNTTTAEVTPAAVRSLIKKYPGAVLSNVRLSELSRWRIGGSARIIVSPRSMEELANLRAWIHERELPSIVIGATSNLLFSDKGLNAVCIRLGADFAPLSISGNKVIAGPGVWVPGLARKAMNAGLTGLEHTCGIPGTLGGLVYMNGGSQRKGIGDTIKKIESINEKGELIARTRDECDFSYRRSLFQNVSEVVSMIELELKTAECKQRVRAEMLRVLRERRTKFPQKTPNCGSVFVSNPDMYKEYGPPGRVIEQLGFKGYTEGGLEISSLHANFIINRGGATARDALRLIKKVRERVASRTGYLMAVEVRYVSSAGVVCNIEDVVEEKCNSCQSGVVV